MASSTVVLILLHVSVITAFNLATNYSIVLSDPIGDNNSYFGYDLNFLLQRGQIWLIIGAPRSKGQGALYRCKIENEHTSSCFQANVDSTENENEAWIGGTIAVEEGENGKLVVCGPRFMVQTNHDEWLTSLVVPGMCYYSADSGETFWRLKQIRNTYSSSSPFYYLLSQSGFSAHFTKDTNDLLIGTPGIMAWTGGMANYKVFSGLAAGWFPEVLRLPNVKENSYLGYAVGSGKFRNQKNRINFVAGAPRAKRTTLTGEVYIIEKTQERKWDILDTLRGEQMGEYFGSSLLAMDINNNGLDDLLVGAPLYSYKQQNEDYTGGDHGRVYVFINKGEATLKLSQYLMGSTKSEAKFGYALANIGDLNKDGFLDLAVGAPYEEGGAVYIYHGSNNGFNKRYSQRITANDISSSISGFGMAIARGLDIDGNSFNDIAIGGYESAHVVVIKSHPIIDFHASIQPSVPRLEITAKEFYIIYCLHYSSQASPQQIMHLDATIRLRVDSILRRAVFPLTESNEYGRQMFLTRDQNICRNITVQLQKDINQVIQPLEVKMDFQLTHNPLDNRNDKRDKEFCAFCPVTDPNKPSFVKTKIPFANGCESNEVCRADLRIWALSDVRNPFILGSSPTIGIKVYVSNKGDPAYMAMLSLQMCPETRLVRVPQNCDIQDSSDTTGTANETITCIIGNPLLGYKGEQQYITVLPFDIDVSSVSLNQSELIFNFKTWSASEEKQPEDNAYSLSIDIQLSADIIITGQSQPSRVMLAKKDGITQLDIFHEYEVINEGPSPVDMVEMRFNVPVGIDPSSVMFLQQNNTHVLLRNRKFDCTVINGEMLGRGPTTDDAEDTKPDQLDISQIQRKKRDLSVGDWSKNSSTTTVAPSNHTVFVNCTGQDTGAVCIEIRCFAGPFISSVDRAKVNISITFRLQDIEAKMVGKDTLQLTSDGWVSIADAEKYVRPEHNRPDMVYVHTFVIGEVKAKEVSSWILPFSIFIGLILLLAIMKTLEKVGFFRRSHRERLQSLKESAAEEDFGSIETMDFADDDVLNKEDEEDG